MLSMKKIISSASTKIWSYQRQCLYIAATSYQQMEDIEDDEDSRVLSTCKIVVDIYLISTIPKNYSMHRENVRGLACTHVSQR
jgi:hypothetical protein